jgi:hypothetical protein
MASGLIGAGAQALKVTHPAPSTNDFKLLSITSAEQYRFQRNPSSLLRRMQGG